MPCFLPILLAGTMLFSPVTALARPLTCSEPLKPICLDQNDTYNRPALMHRCKGDMTDYREKVNAYLSCVEEKSREIEKEAEDSIKGFEERVRQSGQL
jgi:hypothetical protein